jgi:hypothetical protein
METITRTESLRERARLAKQRAEAKGEEQVRVGNGPALARARVPAPRKAATVGTTAGDGVGRVYG